MSTTRRILLSCGAGCLAVLGVAAVAGWAAGRPIGAVHVALVIASGAAAAVACARALRRPADDMSRVIRAVLGGQPSQRVRLDREKLLAQLAESVNDLIAGHESLDHQVRELEAMLSSANRAVDAEAARREALATRRSRQLQAVSELASRDELTGLANRREAMNRLHLLWGAAEVHGDPLACILLDIDHFKPVNDRHGHAAGDAVLRATAGVLARNVRATDVACRLGGEEFLIVCPRGGLRGALACASHLCHAVARHAVAWRGLRLNVTVSLGVAVRTPGMTRIEDLLVEADRGLYAAKRAGRNCVVSAADLPPDASPQPPHARLRAEAASPMNA